MILSITEAISAHSHGLMALPAVVGIAEGRYNEAPCVLVLVVELTDELRAALPSELEGYKVVVSESGEIKAL